MTLVEGEELQRLWALVSELSSQLSSNRELCQSLQAQADELKGQALHTGTGYTLRRFNLDISKEKFDSELEKLNSQLVMENQSLTHENKQINILLREYENTLETVMSKFRSFSHATQQHTLSLTSHYETLLSNDLHQVESASLHASTSFSNTLAHLGGLVRLALREVGGEGLDSDDEDDVKDSDPFEAEGYRVGSPSGIGPSPHTASSSKSTTGAKRAKTGYGSAPSRDPRWYGTGGYTGLQGDPEAEKAERALQFKTEEERLQKENETLRELLRISGDITPEIAREFGIEIPAPPDPSNWPKLGANAGKLSLGKARGSRKSIADLTSPIKTSDITAESEESSQPDSAKRFEAELLKNSGDTATLHDEPLEATASPIPLIVSDAEEDNSTIQSTSTTAEKVIPYHVVQGSGGPPQLGSIADEEDTKVKPGIVVSSQISASNTKEIREDAKAADEGEKNDEIKVETPPLDGGRKSIEKEEGIRLQTSGLTEIGWKDESADTLAAEEKATVRDRLLDEVQETLAEPEEGETTITE